MFSFSVKKFANCNLSDPFFTSLKGDYPEFTQWFSCHPTREALVYEKNGIQAFLALKDGDFEEIFLSSGILSQKKRLKISTLKLSDEVQRQRIGEGVIGYALWQWQAKAFDEIYVTVFPKHKPLIMLLEKFGFICAGLNKRGEGVYIKSKSHLDCSNPYKLFPYIPAAFKYSGYIPINDSYHDSLFPYSALQGNDINYSQEIAAANGITKSYIATPYSALSYYPGQPVLIYRKFCGDHPGYKSAVTSYCSIVEQQIIKNNGNCLLSKQEFVDIVGNKSVYYEDDLTGIFDNNTNLVIVTMLYNGFFGKGHNINWVYLKEHNLWGIGHPYQIKLSPDQFFEVLRKGNVDERNIIINQSGVR